MTWPVHAGPPSASRFAHDRKSGALIDLPRGWFAIIATSALVRILEACAVGWL